MERSRRAAERWPNALLQKRRASTAHTPSLPGCVGKGALGLAAHEVETLDPYVGTSDSEASKSASERLKYWPVSWAVVIDFGIAEVAFAVGSPCISRDAAKAAAPREDGAEVRHAERSPR